MDWTKIKYFKQSEFTKPEKMNPKLIYALDKFRELCGKPVIIHSSFREGDKKQHGLGNAVDIHVVGMNLIDQYLIAEKTGLFNGIGVYSWWNNPGLHLDVRELRENENKARWGSKHTMNYVGLNWFFLKHCLELENDRLDNKND